jgi:hypothetical protein
MTMSMGYNEKYSSIVKTVTDAELQDLDETSSHQRKK